MPVCSVRRKKVSHGVTAWPSVGFKLRISVLLFFRTPVVVAGIWQKFAQMWLTEKKFVNFFLSLKLQIWKNGQLYDNFRNSDLSFRRSTTGQLLSPKSDRLLLPYDWQKKTFEHSAYAGRTEKFITYQPCYTN